MTADAGWSLSRLVESVRTHLRHTAYPVLDGGRVVGAISMISLSSVAPENWHETAVRAIMDCRIEVISPESDLQDALRLLMAPHGQHMLIVESDDGLLEGIVTKTDILSALSAGAVEANEHAPES
jgi:predicted transcriptional regulator